MPIYGNGRNTRDWIHVRDHSNAILTLLGTDSVEGEVFNVGAGNEKTVLEIADLLLAGTGKPASLLAYVVDRLGHDRRYAVDCSKLSRRTGWCPQVSFEEGVRETVDWYKAHEEWWRPLKSGEFLEYYKRNYRFLPAGARPEESGRGRRG
jgi:dTDP-glucose 4,6-dehydratase